MPSPTLITCPAGSGTTLLAAKLLGHAYLGIDVSAEYCEQAQKRLAAPSIKEREAYQDEIAKHQVQKTFAERKANKEHVGRFSGSKSTRMLV